MAKGEQDGMDGMMSIIKVKIRLIKNIIKSTLLSPTKTTVLSAKTGRILREEE